MFLDSPRPDRDQPPRLAVLARWLHTTASLVAAGAAAQPWLAVKFSQVWNENLVVRGWQVPEGFTCLMASAFTVVLNLLESTTQSSRRAVLPGVMMMSLIAALAVAWRWLRGAGDMRGVSAEFTPWIAVALSASALAAVAAVVRYRLLRAAAASQGD